MQYRKGKMIVKIKEPDNPIGEIVIQPETPKEAFLIEKALDIIKMIKGVTIKTSDL